MINKRTKPTPFHYSLSPQKPKKVTGSRLIILRNPCNKLLSPQPLQSDLFIEHPSPKSVHAENNKNKYGVFSTYKISNEFQQAFHPIIDINKFLYPTSVSPMLAVIGLKEALRDREWVAKAREDLTRELSEFINASNGIQIEPPIFGYKYHLGKGNNMALIKQCFNSRWWWCEDSLNNANFIWAQGKSQAFFQNKDNNEIKRPKEIEKKSYDNTIKCNVMIESDTLEEKIVDISCLGYNFITKSQSYVAFTDKLTINSSTVRSHNKLEFNQIISDKKELYLSLKNYYSAIGENIFNCTPRTFHITTGESDPEFLKFSQHYFNETKKKTTWIIKPGENSNRGNGIIICDSLSQIQSELKNNPYPETGEHTFIIQKYIDKPFLVHKRKFDIRLYTLVTSINGILQCYFYQEGYIRTSSKDYNPKALDNKFIHLTNDAVQKKSDDYGKFENGSLEMALNLFQQLLSTL